MMPPIEARLTEIQRGLDDLREAVGGLSDRVNSLDERQLQEVTKCPFSPLRNGEGRKLIDEVAKIKLTVYSMAAFLAGLGILNLWQLIGK